MNYTQTSVGAAHATPRRNAVNSTSTHYNCNRLMKIKLDYGRTGLEVNVPDDRLVGPLAIKDATPLPDPAA